MSKTAGQTVGVTIVCHSI